MLKGISVFSLLLFFPFTPPRPSSLHLPPPSPTNLQPYSSVHPHLTLNSHHLSPSTTPTILSISFLPPFDHHHPFLLLLLHRACKTSSTHSPLTQSHQPFSFTSVHPSPPLCSSSAAAPTPPLHLLLHLATTPHHHFSSPFTLNPHGHCCFFTNPQSSSPFISDQQPPLISSILSPTVHSACYLHPATPTSATPPSTYSVHPISIGPPSSSPPLSFIKHHKTPQITTTTP